MPQEKKFLKTRQDIKSYPVVEGGESLTSPFYFYYQNLLKEMKEGGLSFLHIDKLKWYLGVSSKTFLQRKMSVLMKLNYLLLLTMGQRLNSKGQTNLTHFVEFPQQW